jgi:hypothetical protein
MAKILTITIDNDDKYIEIRDTIIDNFSTYQETIEDPDWVYDPENPDLPGQIPNPVSKNEFFKEYIIDFMKSQYRRAKRQAISREAIEGIVDEDLTIN